MDENRPTSAQTLTETGNPAPASAERSAAPVPRDKRIQLPGGDDLQRQEHIANVLRFRPIMLVAVVLWSVFGVVDWLVVSKIEPAPFGYFLSIRLTETVVVLLVAVVGYRTPIIGPRTMRLLEVALFGTASLAIALMAIRFRGFLSPYYGGIIVVVCARGSALADHWRRGAVYLGLPVAIYVLTLMTATFFSDALRQQLADSRTMWTFALNISFLVSVWLLLAVGNHALWALRRQLFEARSIGKYRLRRSIGAGGMGEVWAAYHSGLRRDVALKVLRPATRDQADRVARFEREVIATGELTHPNTVRIFDHGVTDDGLWYYAMELLEGDNMAELVGQDGPVSAERVIHFISQASRALAEAHGRGIVHRDIKPENLFVTTAGGEPDFVKVLDFGIAKIAHGEHTPTLTATGWIGGTPAYMAPEVAQGKSADARSDVYSLGAVMYFLLAGEPPFGKDKNSAAMMAAHIGEEPKPPSETLGRAIPQDLETIVLRCLRKRPEQRFTSARELAHALAECATDAPPSRVQLD